MNYVLFLVKIGKFSLKNITIIILIVRTQIIDQNVKIEHVFKDFIKQKQKKNLKNHVSIIKNKNLQYQIIAF